MNTLLVGNGYWGNIIKQKLEKITNLIDILDSKSDLEYYLNNYEIDFVFVCSSTSSHYDIVKKCILYKKNVFCEKPFTGDYNKAKELIELSKKNKTKIFIDNIFLYKNIIYKNINNKIIFVWNKYDLNLRENLYDSLLYHDIYLLLMIYSNFNISEFIITKIKDTSTELVINLSGDINIEFLINRNKDKKEKKIYIDDYVLDFDNYKTDTLKEIILKINNGDIDYEFNNNITLNTLNILNILKNNKLI